MSARRGVFIFLLLVAVLGALVLFAALALRGPSTVVHPSTVLIFDVPSELEESDLPYGSYRFGFLRPERPTLWSVIDGIRAAAEDERIEGLVLHIDDIDWGWAKVAEVRDAVLSFRAAGKPVYASLSGGGEREYLLATTAQTLSTEPLAVLQLDGLTASALFFRGTFDKLEVTPNFASVGQYKSGVEGYTRTGMSPAAREALEALLASQYRILVDTLGSARGLPPDSIQRLLDAGPFGAEEALASGLVDTVLYPADLDSVATGGRGLRRPTLSMSRYLARPRGSAQAPRIALVVAEGTIAAGKSREEPGAGRILGIETLVTALRDARARKSVKAVVLRIDSPGGAAQGADEIWREVKRCRAAKPLIVSMSDLAASGGYYIAAPADTILAQPGTITGSIGVFGGKLNILGLYRKLGLNVETVSRGRHAGMLSPFRDFTPEEQELFQSQMDAVYRTFLSRVAEGRALKAQDVDSIGQGRVWSGVDAQERHLVDGLGGLERALEAARAKAGLAPDQEFVVDVYPKIERTILQRLLAELVGEGEDDALAVLKLQPTLRAWIAAARFPSGVCLALMPYAIDIR
ncbi:MAG TPA: signal peptide peptidase SppA [Candidatus Eisenbacteria bacterium]|jgi:protease-4